MKDWDKETDKQRLEHLKELDPESMLHELLALIHGDGGHHTGRAGLAQSVFDAEIKLGERMLEIDRLRNQLGENL